MNDISTGRPGPVQSKPDRETERPETAENRSSILIHEVKSVHPANTGLKRRLAKAEKHVLESQEFARYLAQFDPDRAKKLSQCGGWLLLRQFLDDGETKIAKGQFCQQPLICGFCAAGRAARQSFTVAERINDLIEARPRLKPYMVTLTMRSRPELAPMVRDFWSAWSGLIERRRNALKRGRTSSCLEDINGGVIAGEAKRGRGGAWHYHAHGVLLSDSIDRYKPVWERIKNEWAAQIGQESASVQFAPIRNGVDSSVREVVKYAAKWEPGKHADRWTSAQALHRVRRVRMFGELYGFKLPEEVTDDLTGDEQREFIERLFTLTRRGYRERSRIGQRFRSPSEVQG